MRLFICLSLIFLSSITATLPAQEKGPTPAELKQLNTGLETLQQQVNQLNSKQRVDAEICSKGVEWLLRHDEFYRPNYAELGHRTLKLGEERVEKIKAGQVDWAKTSGVYPVGYRSQIDNSVQPYIISLPEGFDSQARKRWPLYVVLHGRNARLTETSFIAGAQYQKVPEDQNWIQIDVFGRVNNAYRWAGETDVFEAIADVSKRYKIDESRISLWGFSMGGAGAWHLGLHHPSRWASVGAGAGFVDFYKYQKQEKLPEYQHRTLRIYDALDYAQNLNVVPFIAYGGELDKQLQSALFIQEAAAEYDLDLNLIIGPKMGHKFDDESKRKFMEFLGEHNQKGRNRIPGRRDFDFVTYTLKYNQCEWLEIKEQIVPYERTRVHAELNDENVLQVETENVSAFSALRHAADRIQIDGDDTFDLNLAADSNLLEVYFVKDAEGWQTLDYYDAIEFEENPLGNKRHDLQGPIDDAFMQPFLCARGTGTPWSSQLNDYANWSLARFEKEFDKWMRAKILVVDDNNLQEKQIRNRNLILFGDPGSNSVLGKIVDQLPLEWSPESIQFAGKKYSTKDHCPVFIFPNPLNPRRYVVINSGMTTHEKDFKASNSWLFPKLGDRAVIQFRKKDNGSYEEVTVDAGIFNAHWGEQ